MNVTVVRLATDLLLAGARHFDLVAFAVQQAGVLHIKVYDANGKLLHSSQLTNNGMLTARSVDLSAYASGTYLLKIDLVPQLNAIGKTGSYKITKL